MSNLSRNMRNSLTKLKDQKPFMSLKLTQLFNYQKYQKQQKYQKAPENMRIAPQIIVEMKKLIPTGLSERYAHKTSSSL